MKSTNRRNFVITLTAAGTAAAHAGGRARRPKPNIVFILADDLGYGDLNCYGQKNIHTPHLSQMAKDGMIFTDHYAGNTVCAPSRSCLMTGQHTGHTTVRGLGNIPLNEDDPSLAKELKKAGYTTAMIGKWHLGLEESTGEPNQQGFDYYIGYLHGRHAHNYYPEYLWRNGKQYPLVGNKAKDYIASEKAIYSHNVFTQEALEFITAKQEQPFFLYLPYTIPHANNELGAKTGNGMEVPSDKPYSKMTWPQTEKNKAAMITLMDRDIGMILAHLKRLGLEENTIVIFSSDNGPHSEGGVKPEFFGSSGKLRGHKRDLYEGGIRVPLIIKWPGRVQPGTYNTHISAFWDFLPTLCEVAGTHPPENIDGLSFLPTITGRSRQRDHEYLYWESYNRGFSQAVRAGNWKAVKRGLNASIELYDLSSDIGETRNIAPMKPDIIRQMERIMIEAHTESEHFKPKKSKPKPILEKK